MLKNFIKMNFGEVKKIYYKNSFLIQDIKSMYGILIRKEYTKQIQTLAIISSTICNANCVFCANRYLKDKREIMPFNIFKKAINEWEEMGRKRISFTPTIGEVLTDNHFFDKVEYASSKNFKYTILTNGILLEKNIDNLLNSKIKDISFSIGDITSEYDAKVFQIPESVSKKRLESILKLLKRIEAHDKDLNVHLSFRPMRNFKEIVKDMKKTGFWKYYKKGMLDIIYHTAYDNWGGMITEKDLLGFQIMKKPPLIKKYPCSYLSSISILPNGDIRLCGCRIRDTFNDELLIGNINNQSLSEIINSKKYDSIIENWLVGIIPKLCHKCSMYEPKIS